MTYGTKQSAWEKEKATPEETVDFLNTNGYATAETKVFLVDYFTKAQSSMGETCGQENISKDALGTLFELRGFGGDTGVVIRIDSSGNISYRTGASAGERNSGIRWSLNVCIKFADNSKNMGQHLDTHYELVSGEVADIIARAGRGEQHTKTESHAENVARQKQSCCVLL